MSSKILFGVPYLEGGDINPDATLKSSVGNGKPVVVMVYGEFCPHCRNAMPAYQQFARDMKNSVVAVAVQIDGEESDKKAAEALRPVNTSPGVPSFLGFDNQGRYKATHKGGRDAASFKAFASSLLAA